MKAFQDCRYIRLRDQPGVFAACAGSGTAEIQGMCQVFKSGRRRICSLLYRSVSVHLLLGTKGVGRIKAYLYYNVLAVFLEEELYYEYKICNE